jgi:threonine/homoserine/homoserine lactone efflux protein
MHAAAVGLVLGLASGVSPGPLQALVLAQAARHGWRAGAAVALAPLLSDAVIVAVTLLVVSRVGALALAGISAAGGIFVLYLAWDTARTVRHEAALAQSARPGAPPGPTTGAAAGTRRAAVVNFLNPHPWIFWTVVGAPIVLQAARDGIVNAALFVLAFYVGLIGIKVVLSVAVAQGVDWFGSGLQRVVLWISAAGLAAVGVVLLATGVHGLTR